MYKGTMTRDEAIKVAGIETVEAVDATDCDYTNRVLDGTCCAGDVEFSADVQFIDDDGWTRNLIAYYYQDDDDVRGCEDLSDLDWAISGYEIV